MKIDKALAKTAALQAASVLSYILLVASFMWWGQHVFATDPGFFAPVLFLLVFSISALVCGLLVFYRPYKLFASGKTGEAAMLVLYTTAGLIIFFTAVLAAVTIFYK